MGADHPPGRPGGPVILIFGGKSVFFNTVTRPRYAGFFSLLFRTPMVYAVTLKTRLNMIAPITRNFVLELLELPARTDEPTDFGSTGEGGRIGLYVGCWVSIYSLFTLSLL